MPAEIVPGEFCASHYATFLVPSSDGSRKYRVVTHGEGGPSCDCDGYRYRQDCRHAKAVWSEGCMWNCQWHEGNSPVVRKPDHINGGPIIPDSHCPNCAGPLVAVMIAV